ncbi:interleukin-9 [Suncus etruscus]|uniref:interleukin-9 n=1 Tax=Suncus etruscus TaxID=109475 RepID=UPI00210FB35B|nr:interleukin-9 [Suncus etruscus]
MILLVLASALLFCSTTSKRCSTSLEILDVQSLITKEQNHDQKCNCSTNGTNCLCLPIPSDNCTTPCFQEGLSQMINATVSQGPRRSLQRLKKSIGRLKNICPSFSCDQPCNRTTTGNPMTFLTSLLEMLQKQMMKGRI